MDAEVHVRSFFFRLPHISHLRRGTWWQDEGRAEIRRLDQSGKFLGDQKVAEKHLHFRQCFDSAQVCVLPLWSLGIDTTGDMSGVIIHANNLATLWQAGFAER